MIVDEQVRKMRVGRNFISSDRIGPSFWIYPIPSHNVPILDIGKPVHPTLSLLDSECICNHYLLLLSINLSLPRYTTL